MRLLSHWMGCLLLVLIASGCGREDVSGEPEGASGIAGDSAALGTGLPRLGTSQTFDVASWNLKWFGAPDRAPMNDLLQAENVQQVVAALDYDLWVLSEVVSEAHFTALVEGLPGYGGLLVKDPSVAGSESFGFPGAQLVGILYKRPLIEVRSAKVVLAEHRLDFGFRPPMEVELEVSAGGQKRTLALLALHLKAMTDAESYARRQRSAAVLRTHVDDHHAGRWLLVAGDWNDDIDVSTRKGEPSPFGPFLEDTDYAFTTAALSEAGIATTTEFPATIDHHLVSASLLPRYIEGSATAFPADAHISRFSETTSDHLPVLTQYDLF